VTRDTIRPLLGIYSKASTATSLTTARKSPSPEIAMIAGQSRIARPHFRYPGIPKISAGVMPPDFATRSAGPGTQPEMPNQVHFPPAKCIWSHVGFSYDRSADASCSWSAPDDVHATVYIGPLATRLGSDSQLPQVWMLHLQPTSVT